MGYTCEVTTLTKRMHMNKTVLVAVITLLVGVGIGMYVSGGKGSYETGEFVGRNSHADMMGMSGMQGHMMHMTVSSEQEFIEGMIPHHQEAVDTAKEVLARGATTPEIKTLVENIVQAQEAEIASMKMWYKTWYGREYVDTNTYQPMMRPLATLSGAELDKAFLEDMIMHHMGAIMMARSVQPYVEHEEVKNLTEAIVTTQSQEIMQMRGMLQNL